MNEKELQELLAAQASAAVLTTILADIRTRMLHKPMPTIQERVLACVNGSYEEWKRHEEGQEQ